MTATCPHCGAIPRPNARFCNQCGKSLPAQPEPGPTAPQLELFDFRPWFPAGSYTGFGLRLKPFPNLDRVRVRLEGRLAEQGDAQLELDRLADGSFETYFECLSPQEGGMLRVRFAVDCTQADGYCRQFRGTTGIPLIANHWQEDVIRRNLKGLVVELRNKGGLLRQEGGFATPIDKLIVDNEDGITRLMGDIESGGVLSWQVPLSTQGTALAAEPALTDQACLQFLTGGGARYCRLFAKDRLVLGRYKTAADIWLSLFPLSDPSQQIAMERMSGEHALIRRFQEGYQVQDRSRFGTWLNGERLRDEWRDLNEGDRLHFQAQAPLTLKVHLRPGGGLHLKRLGNGADKEDFLLLPPETPAARNTARPRLSHERGGFLLHPERDGAQINGRPLIKGMANGLRNSDLVECTDLAFFYWELAYPVEEAGHPPSSNL